MPQQSEARELDIEKVRQRIGFVPTEFQNNILTNSRRFNIIPGGKRVGKSILVAYLALIELLTSNKNIWVVGPTYDLARRPWDYLELWAHRYFPGVLKTYRAPEPMVESVFGSKLELKSAENEKSLLGKPLDLVILDEAARQGEDIYERYIRPNLIDRKGRSFLISNPYGKNWFYDQFILASHESDYNRFHVPTAIEDRDGQVIASNNPNSVSVEELQRIKKTTPEHIWRQEYLAEFLEGAGQVFRNVRKNISGVPLPPEKHHLYLIGVDLGRLHSFTVITVIDRSTRRVVHHDRFKGIDWKLQRDRITKVARDYNDAVITVDSTGVGDPIVEELKNASLSVEDFRYTSTSKVNLINKLATFIERGSIKYPNVPVMIDELESFIFEKSAKSDRIIYSAPGSRFDDCVHSLALACWLLEDEELVPIGTAIDVDRPEMWYAQKKDYS